MSAHSPGPWRHECGGVYSGFRVVARKDWRYDDDDPQWIADSRLIVAAPALLEALKELLRTVPSGLMSGPGDMSRARAFNTASLLIDSIESP